MVTDINKARIALVHDYLNQYGGAERVLEAIHGLFPQAPVYTLLYDQAKLPDHFKLWEIRASFLNRMPGRRRHYQKMLPLFPLAIESFDLRDYDIVISSSNAWAKGAVTSGRTFHLCYIHTPMRFVRDWYHHIPFEHNALTNVFLLPLLNRIRGWDTASAARPDCYISNSNEVQDRVSKYYRRPSQVIYPPVNTDFFRPADAPPGGDYFLTVSRLKPYKRLDLAVKAFNEMDLKLTIVGEGSELNKLKKMAGPKIKLAGRVSDMQLLNYYQNCRALVFPGLEDFGIAPVEAQSCGRPVIAYGKGGCRETVIDKGTGILFSRQTEAGLMEAVRSFKPEDFDRQAIRRHALSFDRKIFVGKFTEMLANQYSNFIKKTA
ncbi:glycosyltransferase [candidate division TA06 bacterium]|uniref:Glycosyltransferase n=1 Tax=candidate division TA06 bacterium TaxID=2250710 RepID=A0A933MHN1_UNCT6|nr:glycosyltransferase [candidate division TA06 bacterium]